MDHKKLMESIMEMIKAQMLTAKTKAEYKRKPLHLPEEPKRLKLN